MKQFFYVLSTALLFASCRPKKMEENSHFPPEVQIIFTNKCATAGCHNDKSYFNAGGLNLTSWESLFKGSVNGTVAIPFSPSHSSMMQFVNTSPTSSRTALLQRPQLLDTLLYRALSRRPR
jgi:hypothetical protein